MCCDSYQMNRTPKHYNSPETVIHFNFLFQNYNWPKIFAISLTKTFILNFFCQNKQISMQNEMEMNGICGTDHEFKLNRERERIGVVRLQRCFVLEESYTKTVLCWSKRFGIYIFWSRERDRKRVRSDYDLRLRVWVVARLCFIAHWADTLLPWLIFRTIRCKVLHFHWNSQQQQYVTATLGNHIA